MAKTVSYNPLWKLLIDKKMNRQDLKDATGISTATIAKLGKGENVTTAVLLKICNGLNCELSDIMETIEGPDEAAHSADLAEEKDNK